VVPVGPRIYLTKKIYSINGIPVGDNDTIIFAPNTSLDIVALISSYNIGSDIALNTKLGIKNGPAYYVLLDSCLQIAPIRNPSPLL